MNLLVSILRSLMGSSKPGIIINFIKADKNFSIAKSKPEYDTCIYNAF